MWEKAVIVLMAGLIGGLLAPAGAQDTVPSPTAAPSGLPPGSNQVRPGFFKQRSAFAWFEPQSRLVVLLAQYVKLEEFASAKISISLQGLH